MGLRSRRGGDADWLRRQRHYCNNRGIREYTTPQITAGSYDAVAMYTGKQSDSVNVPVAASSCSTMTDLRSIRPAHPVILAG
jgi:hypothetical protein